MGRQSVAVPLALIGLLAVGCSTGHSTPITPAAKTTALSQLGAIPAPAGFVHGSDPCTDGYVCFHSATGAAVTEADYKRLSSEFGVRLTGAHCDPMVAANNGPAIQTCLAYGRYRGWGVAALLTVRRIDAGHSETDVAYAPVREFD
jgi:hypothetical protein